jgi:hypothetical protein
MSNTGTRTLDTIFRIYKNADGDALGMHCVEVIENREETPLPGRDETGTMDDRKQRRLTTNVGFTRLNLVMGSSRIVATVQMMGGYDDFAMNGSNDDILQVTYGAGFTNESHIDFNLFPTVGDSL